MKLVIVTDGLGMHVCATADAYYKILGNDFTYISAKKPNGEGIHKFGEIGKTYVRPYMFYAWNSEESKQKAKEIVDNADVVIAGGYSFPYIVDRLRDRKLTFLSGERWFKHLILSPMGYISIYRTLLKYQNENFYFLSSGAYGSNDAKRLGIFKNRILKGAYMVSYEEYDSMGVIDSRHNEKIEILWCARFIRWKHPELVIRLAQLLVKDGYRNFHITMIGANTPLQNRIKESIAKFKLSSFITIIEGLPNNETRLMMRESDIFLATSDRQEGWGAVVNEAMSESCAIVASDEVGSVPFLLKHRKNGMIFKSKDVKSLYLRVKELIDYPELRRELAYNSYRTITEEWTADIYANRMVTLCNSLLNGREIEYTEGPVSKAYPCDKKSLSD